MSYQRSARGGKVTTRSRIERRPTTTHEGINNNDIPVTDYIQTKYIVMINPLNGEKDGRFIEDPKLLYKIKSDGFRILERYRENFHIIKLGLTPYLELPDAGPDKGTSTETSQVVKPPRDSCNPDDANHSNVTRPHNATTDQKSASPEKGLSSPPAKPKKSSARALKIAPSPKKCSTSTSSSPSPAKPNRMEPAVEVTKTESKAPDGNHSTIPPHGKNHKILIKGLPADTDSNSIKENLEKTGFHVGKITQFKKRVGVAYKPLPLFLVIIPASQSSDNIFNLSSLLDKPIRVERFRGGRLQVQCYRCQGFGHLQFNCTQPPRCLKCAGGHLSYECTKDSTTAPKCCNCSKSHTANFSGCEARPRRKRANKRKPKTQQPQATSTPGPKDRIIALFEELKALLKDKDTQQIFNALLRPGEV